MRAEPASDERVGRLLFLSYLKPLINGQGFYHIESQLTDLRRMDIVVDFGPEHVKAYEQLAGYMASKGFDTGYLLTFDFRKDVKKQQYAEWADYNGVQIFDVVI